MGTELRIREGDLIGGFAKGLSVIETFNQQRAVPGSAGQIPRPAPFSVRFDDGRDCSGVIRSEFDSCDQKKARGGE